MYIHRQWVCGWEGVRGVLRCVGDHILQKLNTLFLTRFRPTKLLHHPKQKPRKGGGLRQINTCRKVPTSLRVQVPSTLPAHPLAPHTGHLPEEGQGPLRLQEEQHQRGGTIQKPFHLCFISFPLPHPTENLQNMYNPSLLPVFSSLPFLPSLSPPNRSPFYFPFPI